MALTSVSAVKNHLGIAQTDTALDNFLAQLLSAVESAFAHLTDRQLELSDYTCYPEGSGNEILLLPEIPVVTVTGVWVDQAAYYGGAPNAFADATKLVDGVHYTLVKDGRNGEGETGRLLKINGVWPGRWVSKVGLLTPVFRPGAGSIKVSYSAGFDPIPDDVQLCIWQTVARLKAERTTGRPILSESFEDYSIVAMQDDAKAALQLGTAAQIVAKYRRIRRRHKILG